MGVPLKEYSHQMLMTILSGDWQSAQLAEHRPLKSGFPSTWLTTASFSPATTSGDVPMSSTTCRPRQPAKVLGLKASGLSPALQGPATPARV